MTRRHDLKSTASKAWKVAKTYKPPFRIPASLTFNKHDNFKQELDFLDDVLECNESGTRKVSGGSVRWAKIMKKDLEEVVEGKRVWNEEDEERAEMSLMQGFKRYSSIYGPGGFAEKEEALVSSINQYAVLTRFGDYFAHEIDRVLLFGKGDRMSIEDATKENLEAEAKLKRDMTTRAELLAPAKNVGLRTRAQELSQYLKEEEDEMERFGGILYTDSRSVIGRRGGFNATEYVSLACEIAGVDAVEFRKQIDFYAERCNLAHSGAKDSCKQGFWQQAIKQFENDVEAAERIGDLDDEQKMLMRNLILKTRDEFFTKVWGLDLNAPPDEARKYHLTKLGLKFDLEREERLDALEAVQKKNKLTANVEENGGTHGTENREHNAGENTCLENHADDKENENGNGNGKTVPKSKRQAKKEMKKGMKKEKKIEWSMVEKEEKEKTRAALLERTNRANEARGT